MSMWTIFRTVFLKQYYFSPISCERPSGRLGAVVPVNSRNVCRFESLFCARGCCPHSARAIHHLGCPRRLRDTLPPHFAVAAYRLSDLGNSHGTASVAMPSDLGRELARRQGRS